MPIMSNWMIKAERHHEVPKIEGRHLQEGLTIAAETMAEFGGGKIEGIEVVL